MGQRPTQGDEKRLGQQPLFMKPSPFPLSSRAKPRDLQFRGSFLKTLNSIVKQNCHLDRSVAEWRDLRFYVGATKF
jgi:hypothetical protein